MSGTITTEEPRAGVPTAAVPGVLLDKAGPTCAHPGLPEAAATATTS